MSQGIILHDFLYTDWERGRVYIKEQFEQLYGRLRAQDRALVTAGGILQNTVIDGDPTVDTVYISNTGADHLPKWARISLTNGVSGELALSHLPDGAASTLLGTSAAGTGTRTSITLNPALKMSSTALDLSRTFVRKTSDESVTSSTTLQNDDALLFPVAANEIWEFHASVFYTAAADAANGQLKLAFTVPSGATFSAGAFGKDSTGTTAIGGFRTAVLSTSGTASGAFGGAGATPLEVKIDGIIVNGSNAGNVTLQWAQQVSFGTATTVLTNSFLVAARIS